MGNGGLFHAFSTSYEMLIKFTYWLLYLQRLLYKWTEVGSQNVCGCSGRKKNCDNETSLLSYRNVANSLH